MDRSRLPLWLICLLLTTVAIQSANGQLIPVTPGFNAGVFVLTPDASHVIFEKSEGAGTLLYSARTDGVGAPVPISPTAGGGAFLFNSRISPDSSWIIYNRNEFPTTRLHVSTYASRIDGSAPPVLLNTSPIFDDDPSQYNMAISPDSRYAVIRADQGDDIFDLISRRIDGSTPPLLLNGGPHSANSGVGYDWTASGDRVIFQTRGGEEGPGFFSRVMDGSNPLVRLSPEGEGPGSAVVSADGSTVLLSTFPEGGPYKLYGNSTAGGALTPLPFNISPPATSVRGFSISPDGQHGLVVDSEFRLWTLPTDGSSLPRQLAPFPSSTSLGTAVFPDGTNVVHISREGHHGQTGLFISPIDGSGTHRRLSFPPTQDWIVNFVHSPQFSSDGRYLVYGSDEISERNYDLFSVPLDGSTQPVRLAALTSFTLTPDGQWVVAALDTNANSFFDQFVAIPIGGGDPVLLAENPYLTGGIPTWGPHWHLSQDGSMLVFMADNNAGVREIFAVSIPEPSGLFVVGFGAALMSGRVVRRSRANLR